jgi:hypothetical protein
MRKLVVASTLLLTITGLPIAYGWWVSDPGAPSQGAARINELAHIWLGVAYLVVFPLYAWDHINKNRRWLRVVRGVTASGLLQLACGIVALATGIVLLAYGGATLRGVRLVHHAATYGLLGALTWHWLVPKKWKG